VEVKLQMRSRRENSGRNVIEWGGGKKSVPGQETKKHQALVDKKITLIWELMIPHVGKKRNSGTVRGQTGIGQQRGKEGSTQNQDTNGKPWIFPASREFKTVTVVR